jgi:hypothetical protein
MQVAALYTLRAAEVRKNIETISLFISIVQQK